jgi:Cu/Ag efflux protein CusF
MQSQSLVRWFDRIAWQAHTRRLWRDVMAPVRNVYHGTTEQESLSTWSASCVLLSLFVFTGCATAYTPPVLTTQHPAHPEALAAPEQPLSTTLSYGPSDVPASQPTTHMAQREMQQAMQHGTPGTRPSAPESQQAVVGEGKVIAVVPSSSQIVVDHKEIKGFMDAMTMGYRVEPPSLLGGVQTGDAVRFTIDPQQKAIVKIEKMNQ